MFLFKRYYTDESNDVHESRESRKRYQRDCDGNRQSLVSSRFSSRSNYRERLTHCLFGWPCFPPNAPIFLINVASQEKFKIINLYSFQRDKCCGTNGRGIISRKVFYKFRMISQIIFIKPTEKKTSVS